MGHSTTVDHFPVYFAFALLCFLSFWERLASRRAPPLANRVVHKPKDWLTTARLPRMGDSGSCVSQHLARTERTDASNLHVLKPPRNALITTLRFGDVLGRLRKLLLCGYVRHLLPEVLVTAFCPPSPRVLVEA